MERVWYFLAAGCLVAGLQCFRYPLVSDAGKLPACPEPLWYAMFTWFVLFSLVKVGGLGALLYAFLIPFILKSALSAFPPRKLAPVAVLLGWTLSLLGCILTGLDLAFLD
ncbi:MAG: hypothetical protein ACI91G_001153 [Gammaproteobacteria bacterium]|jgi:hypothetical protein